MSEISKNLKDIQTRLAGKAKLIAVSKTKLPPIISEAYSAGQRAFGENYVQELVGKAELLPPDIEWHFIGHLQSNKVKFIAPFVSWIHAVESEKLLSEINKQAEKNNRIINCLLQVYISQDETKFGFTPDETVAFCRTTDFSQYPHVRICGLMGMASFIDDQETLHHEFRVLKDLFDVLKKNSFAESPYFTEISMGMSSDWQIAVEEGSTMVRIGSAIFGAR